MKLVLVIGVTPLPSCHVTRESRFFLFSSTLLFIFRHVASYLYNVSLLILPYSLLFILTRVVIAFLSTIYSFPWLVNSLCFSTQGSLFLGLLTFLYAFIHPLCYPFFTFPYSFLLIFHVSHASFFVYTHVIVLIFS